MSADLNQALDALRSAVKRSMLWMDARGPVSWIALMVAGFIFGGPHGLIVLAFILITGRFSRRGARHAYNYASMQMPGSRGTGNEAFDAYKADTLARLEREHADFETFLGRLRAARDKAEFDQYLRDHATAGPTNMRHGAPPRAD